MEDKSYKLIQSYVKEKYFVSTIYRQSSAMVPSPPWYFETMAWTWDLKTKERGELLVQEDSGITEEQALEDHLQICKNLIENQSCE